MARSDVIAAGAEKEPIAVTRALRVPDSFIRMHLTCLLTRGPLRD